MNESVVLQQGRNTSTITGWEPVLISRQLSWIYSYFHFLFGRNQYMNGKASYNYWQTKEKGMKQLNVNTEDNVCSVLLYTGLKRRHHMQSMRQNLIVSTFISFAE